MGDDINIRIPVIENFATQYAGILAISSRVLTSEEKTIAEPIFKQSIKYDEVRIVTTKVVAAPTTLGNNIRVLAGIPLSRATLIHELTHVWQFQTRGNSYISNSLINQTVGVIASGDRNAAYNYTIVPGKSIHKYPAEHQAMIVEDYYKDQQLPPALQKLQTNADFVRMIAEVRSGVPRLTNMDRYLESLYGAQYQNPRYFDQLPSNNINPTQVAPIIRVEF